MDLRGWSWTVELRKKLHPVILLRKDFIPSGPEINPADQFETKSYRKFDVVKPSRSADAEEQLSESLASKDGRLILHTLAGLSFMKPPAWYTLFLS